ncbi:bucky ball-like isoform X2 [Heptranchias perlo]|uniref:bucky ball-like isoform X2 n=1 Tax=Heptranchias perlo TaxID=212740 RepID=UPI00355A97FA
MILPPILDSCIFILTLCLLPIAMNSSPTGHRAEDGYAPNHNRPFFFQPMPTPHMFAPPVSHFLHPPAFQPYFYPTVEFGSGLYYPVCPMPYPRSFGPQSPMTHTNYRRPYFNSSFVARPTFYHSTRFRHTPFRRNVTNTEVQTDTETNPGQTKRADVVTETSSQTAEIRIQKSSGIESASSSADVLGQERLLPKEIRDEPHETEEISATMASKSAKPGGYAFQKEKIRIECSEGAPSINVWRSFEATLPIYNNTPNNKAEDRIQCEVWSVSACESGVPFYSSFEADKMIQKTDVPTECTISATPQAREMLLDSNQCPESGGKSRAKGARIPYCTATLGKADTVPCKTNESRMLPTKEFQQERSEKLAQQRSPSGLAHKNGIEENETRNEESDHQIISLKSLNEEEMCEVLKSDGSLESVEEYVPSASVLAWLQTQARSWKNSLSQTMRDRPGVVDESYEEMSSKDEESSFDFFDAMPARKQVSYSHLMCDPHYQLLASDAQVGSKSLENQRDPETEKVFCSTCQKETLLKAKSENYVVCRDDWANRNIGSDVLSETDYLSRDQLMCVNPVTGRGRRKNRRISRESCSSNKNKKKTRYSSDSEAASEDLDNDSRAGLSEKVKVDGSSSRKKIVRRPSKVSALQISNRPQQEKPKGKKKGPDGAKYTVNQREQNRVGNEHNERQKSGQTARPERKRKEEDKRRKYTRKAMSVQNESEESVDEYWNKVGAKPKSATQSLDDAEHEKLQQKVKTICKSVPHKRASLDFNEMETWESSCLHGFRGNSLRRGRTKKRC